MAEAKPLLQLYPLFPFLAFMWGLSFAYNLKINNHQNITVGSLFLVQKSRYNDCHTAIST